MNVLIISSEFPPGPGGIGQHAASLALALAGKGHVQVLTQQDYADLDQVRLYNRTLSDTFSIHSFLRIGWKFKPLLKTLQAVRMVGRNSFDLVLVTGQISLIIGALLKRTYPKQIVRGFVHGTEVSLTGSLLSKVTVWAYKRLDHIYAVSNYTKSLLHPTLNRAIVSVIPNGLDADMLLKTGKEKIKPFYEWKGKPKILTVGNLTPRKGQHRVVKALPEICRRFPEAHYHMVGLPTDELQIRNMAKDLDVEHAITIHGRLPKREDLYRAYASVDVFIMLSENQKNGDLEGFGIAILEANAFGVPAIGAKGCGIEDAISSDSGILVDGDDHLAIADALEDLIKQSNDFHIAAKKWAEKHNWNELVNLVDDV